MKTFLNSLRRQVGAAGGKNPFKKRLSHKFHPRLNAAILFSSRQRLEKGIVRGRRKKKKKNVTKKHSVRVIESIYLDEHNTSTTSHPGCFFFPF